MWFMRKFSWFDADLDLSQVLVQVLAGLQQRRWKNLKIVRSPEDAFKALKEMYEAQVQRVAHSVRGLATTDPDPQPPGYYPGVAVLIDDDNLPDESPSRSYGFVQCGPGVYSTTVTRPDSDLLEQLQILHESHGKPFIVGLSEYRIPVEFIPSHLIPDFESLTREQILALGPRDVVEISESVDEPPGYFPLSLYSGPYTDEMAQRVKYYTSTAVEHFQKYVFVTNYQMYVDAFLLKAVGLCTQHPDTYSLVIPKKEEARLRIADHRYQLKQRFDELDADLKSNSLSSSEVVERFAFLREAWERLNEDLELLLNSRTTGQMPAYHLKMSDGTGMTLINVGVGGPNAATAVGMIAPSRPRAVIMVGHSGALRKTINVGTYILADGYYRKYEGVFENELPLDRDIPVISEIQLAIAEAIGEVFEKPKGDTLRGLVQRVTVASTSQRLNEVFRVKQQRLDIVRAAHAVDMETTILAAGCYLESIPFGTCLIVSDNYLKRLVKGERGASHLYRSAVDNHMEVSFRVWHKLRLNPECTASRKLRAYDAPPFR